MMDVKEQQSTKAVALILVTLLGMVIDLRDVQPENSYSPKIMFPLMQLLITTDSKEVQPEKTESPILLVEDGISMEVKLLQQ